jgi:drug/metabolite transporter (DMT)-like permease
VFSAGVARTSAIHGAMILAMLPVFTGAIAHAWERRRRPGAGGRGV